MTHVIHVARALMTLFSLSGNLPLREERALFDAQPDVAVPVAPAPLNMRASRALFDAQPEAAAPAPMNIRG